MDRISKIALSISLAAHIALIYPYGTLKPAEKTAGPDITELNYIIIRSAELAEKEEVIEQSVIEEETVPVERADPFHESFLAYHNLIRERIRAEIHSYMDNEEEGTIVALFTLSPGGFLTRIHSLTGPASPHLKNIALKGIKSAQPFPPFPVTMGTGPLNFCLTIEFIK